MRSIALNNCLKPRSIMNTALKQLSETEEHNEEHSIKQLPETEEHNEHSVKAIV